MKRLITISLTGLFLAMQMPLATGAVMPTRTTFDHHIQTVRYNPDDVVTVHVSPGSATLIQLQQGEALSGGAAGLGLGDPEAWDIAVKEQNIWLRPKAEEPDTNISMVTNRRTYVLQLKSSNTPAWLVRFDYPAPPTDPFGRHPLPSTSATPCMTTTHINRQFAARGDTAIWPVEVWSDGRFTCMRFAGNRDLPTVTRVLPSHDNPERGVEALPNTQMKDDVLVIHSTDSYYRLRLGDLVAGIKTDTALKAGYNYTGTSTGETRTLKATQDKEADNG